MKIQIETPLNIGDAIYYVLCINGKPDADVEENQIYGFSVRESGIWIENNEYGDASGRLDDVDSERENSSGIILFSSYQKAVDFIERYYDGKENNQD